MNELPRNLLDDAKQQIHTYEKVSLIVAKNLIAEVEKLQAENEQLRKDAERMLDKAKSLWSLLDDIDTYSDMFKPELTAYVKAVDKKTRERHQYLSTDGYELFDKAKAETK